MSETELAVYRLIRAHYLAQFLPHHELDRTISRLSCAGQHLQAVGKQIVIQGWRLVLADQQPVDVDDESAPRSQVLPALKQGLSCQVTGVRSEEHTSELQSLMRISYAVFCLKKQKRMSDNAKHKT